MENDNTFLVRTLQEWDNVLDRLSTDAIFVAKPHTKYDGSPLQFPCIVKVAETVVLDEDNVEVVAYFVMLFYKDDALNLLGMRRSDVKDYKYAEAV